jgi:hypothetical protein
MFWDHRAVDLDLKKGAKKVSGPPQFGVSSGEMFWFS